MNWFLDKSRPICPQICEHICIAITRGELSSGKKLLSVREIALQAGVNPNTVQKSLAELERRGIIHSVPASGWYVNQNTETASLEVKKLRLKKTREYLTSMFQLGCNTDDIIEYINNCKEENT